MKSENTYQAESIAKPLSISLGNALALLRQHNDINALAEVRQVAHNELKFVRDLHTRLNSAHVSANGFLIPTQPCLLENPFLADNHDFFLNLFIVNPPDFPCQQLMRHLNDCYSCFEFFTQVMRDFCHELNQKAK